MAGNKKGRPKGVIEASSRRVRSAIASLIDQDFTLDEIRRLIDKVEKEEGAKKAFDCYVVLSDFVLPRLQRVEHTGADGEKLSISHVLASLHPPDPSRERLTAQENLSKPENRDIIDVETIKQTEES